MHCKAQSHNWQLQWNCSTGQRQQERSQLSLQTKSKTVLEMSRRLWRTLRDDGATDAQQLQWRRDPASTQFWCGAWGCRDQSRVFCTPSLAICPTHCSQLDLHPANLEATIEAKWILNSLSSCENGIFFNDVQLRHYYILSCKYWWHFWQSFSHPKCQDDLCQKLWKFA